MEAAWQQVLAASASAQPAVLSAHCPPHSNCKRQQSPPVTFSAHFYELAAAAGPCGVSGKAAIWSHGCQRIAAMQPHGDPNTGVASSFCGCRVSMKDLVAAVGFPCCGGWQARAHTPCPARARVVGQHVDTCVMRCVTQTIRRGCGSGWYRSLGAAHLRPLGLQDPYHVSYHVLYHVWVRVLTAT